MTSILIRKCKPHKFSIICINKFSTQTDVQKKAPRDPLNIAFEDGKASFKSKTTWELVRGYLVYSMCSVDVFVMNNVKIMKAFKKVFGTKIFTECMKLTFYGHFVAGETQDECMPTLKRLDSFGVRPILDYSVEEDLSHEEAEKRSISSVTTEIEHKQTEGSLKQFHIDKKFADRRYKVTAARTYFYLNEATCEKTMETIIKCVEAVAHFEKNFGTPSSIQNAAFGAGITAIKLTGLGRPQLLLQFSEVITRGRKFMADLAGHGGNVISHHMTREEFIKKLEEKHIKDKPGLKEFLDHISADKEGILHLFPWTGIIDENQEYNKAFQIPDIKTGKMISLLTELTAHEVEMFHNMIRRVKIIANRAKELDVRIMIDAEQTYFQPAISRITLEFMRKYNKEKVMVFNTYQCYLQDAINEVNADLEQAKRQNFHFGCKLVRGAYLEQERARAASMGYKDPTCPTFEATNEMYQKCTDECLKRALEFHKAGEKNKVGFMIASHNEDSVRYTIKKMEEMGIQPNDQVVCFGQLLGMCDYLTFPLGQSGYSAYKYVPYGPVNEVLPYLSRRATENRGVFLKIKKEKRLLRNEILRRFATGSFYYTPKGNYTPS